MKFVLLVIGKTNVDYLNSGIEDYLKRLKHYIHFEIKELQGIKVSKKHNVSEIKEKEGKLILRNIKPQDYVILLDEAGKSFSSIQFSSFVENKTVSQNKNVVFVVGGAFGFSKEIYDRANDKISMSKMTFSHQFIRLLFVEQLYRALTIIKGEPYHNQ
ncbi:MAG: 23S rRNA (pseudouridine(1915)-N(3))-methyltransferase RlmH [Bacteroidetes bacterium]|jgi:23S rRNA (pseudouridine1915-N3)-methyltransferase|nr:23S rRNA (pseudouridine(1915)-N(3))-methyltransferase RlmH [Bacteroidota bacterium]MBT6687528.1 23S rRNA (pseudouridine(1915)-N(3))-methyltransferase RlmH [Bacteroidota bacterium]MBT7142759.1 23S rRNA (pseudouridine(1915)-N(3))-methyltransferase RlmH [Bacteroidota bacterium]MBT7491962.1 23S rRNA (pseudouridine(1915)-N(3))-methyltransferase RlmH [Bacteroidota bacterium]